MIESINGLLSLMVSYGANRFYAKKLARNDNSKNQVYLGSDFSTLNIIPHQGIYTDGSIVAGSRRDRAKALILFSWIDEHGCYDAAKTQLILYPKYPEVRMSGFLKECLNAPSDVMRSREEGRVLFFGITNHGRVLGYAVGPLHPLAQEIYSRSDVREVGVFSEIVLGDYDKNSRTHLLEKLTEIYGKRWISSQKLGSDGLSEPYVARNGGGYTLEAELGISPNGYSEPDYLGWEVKQYGVSDFDNFRPKSPITLMTPEPTGGFYRDKGIVSFMSDYGYMDKNGNADRRNFGGIYACGRDFHAETGLRLELKGYDIQTKKITDMAGGIILLSRRNEIAAIWEFSRIMSHWNRKHAQAAYVPSLFRTPPPEYSYGPRVFLCEKTDFTLFLGAIADGVIYYDPAIKMENFSSLNPTIKKRSQFRIKYAQLTQIYRSHEFIRLDTVL